MSEADWLEIDVVVMLACFGLFAVSLALKDSATLFYAAIQAAAVGVLNTILDAWNAGGFYHAPTTIWFFFSVVGFFISRQMLLEELASGRHPKVTERVQKSLDKKRKKDEEDK